LRKPVSRAELTSQLQHFWKSAADWPGRVAEIGGLPEPSQTVASGTPERTAELLVALVPLEQTVWPTLAEAPVISEVLEFGEALHALAIEHGSPALLQYAQELTTRANSFELTEMENSLQDFLEVVSVLRHHSGLELAAVS
jgi:hypothetical protein